MALCGFGAPPGRTSWPSPWCDTGANPGVAISAVLGVPLGDIRLRDCSE